MRFAINFANFGYLGDVDTLVELACDAEAAGWDGVFLWDHVNWTGMGFHADPWIALGLIAARTERVQIGTAVTPIARRRPVKLAREILTLQQLADGRFVFGAGSGLWPSEFDDLGDSGDLKTRAAMLDEGLDLLRALFAGGPVDHAGVHYRAKLEDFGTTGTTVPIWLAGMWPNRAPFRRAARFDGAMPIAVNPEQPLTTDETREVAALIAEHRETDAPFELSCGLRTTDDAQADAATAAAYEEAGATLWMDSVFPPAEPLDAARVRIRRGPPKLQ